MRGQLQLGDNDDLVALSRAWEKTVSLLAPEINRPSFEYFRSARPVSMEGSVATIGATNELAKIFLEKYSELAKAALESCLGREIELHFVVVQPEQRRPRVSEVRAATPPTGVLSSLSHPLNDKYVFSTFVVGPSNRLAHAAALAIAQKPGRVYNPFFLYGGPGLGKTHLLQAVGHYAIAHHPGIRVAYVSGELFTSHYVTALREHRSEDFRRKYRNIDILLVDDVQFLASRERTKEEFFHTFNALYQMNKQIVLSSDRSPRDLGPIEERLKSRFESGLVADIAPPDLETRLAILQNKASSDEVDVPMPVLEYIANCIPTNVRALEGALVTLMAYSSLMKQPLTVSLAQEVLGRYMTEKKYAELTPEIIQRVVAQAFGVEVKDIQNQTRKKELVIPRHVAMYLSRELTPFSTVAIGKAFGGRDHATVIRACTRIKALMDEDPCLLATVNQLAQDLKTGRV